MLLSQGVAVHVYDGQARARGGGGLNTVGQSRIGMSRTRQEAAAHEAGHALAAYLLYGPGGVAKVRIKNVEKGQVWTQIIHQPVDGPAEQLKAKIRIALAGVAAEHLLLDNQPAMSKTDIDYQILEKAAKEFGQELTDLDEWFSESEQLLEPHLDKLKAVFEYLKVHDNLGPEKLAQLLEGQD